MNWFRWHQGSVTDPKFKIVARRADVTVGHALAVWAVLLEEANASHDRGRIEHVDFEAIDALLDLEDGVSERIYDAFLDKEMVCQDGTIAAWDKRQVKREDATALKRKQEQRARDNQKKVAGHAASRNVTHGPAQIRREENRNLSYPPTPQAPSRPPDGGGGAARAKEPQQPQEPQPQEPTAEQLAEAQAAIDKACESMGVSGGFFLGRGEVKKAGPVLQPLVDDWKARFGGVPKHQALRSAMLPLVEEHGLAEVQERWRRYLAKVESRFASPGSFAAKWDEWAPPRAQPCHLRRFEDLERERMEEWEKHIASLPPDVQEITRNGTPEQKLALARKLAEQDDEPPRQANA